MQAMSDPNLDDFYRRIARVQSAHAKGYGFEATGAVGRSAYARPGRRRFALLRPVLATAVAILLLKSLIHYHIGSQTYDDRVAALVSGEGFDRVGGLLMTADPVTLWLSAVMTEYLPRFF